MRSLKVLAAISLFMLFVRCPLVQAAETKTSIIYVQKKAYFKGHPSIYLAPLRLPADSATGRILPPSSVKHAVSILRSGIDPGVLRSAVLALNEACESEEACDLGSPDLWDSFIDAAERREVESRFSLLGYLAMLEEAIAREWTLAGQCLPNSSLCSELRSAAGKGSPDMLAALLIRMAVVAESGRAWQLRDAVRSMGDMLLPPEPDERPREDC